jgi:hypothetical protein
MVMRFLLALGLALAGLVFLAWEYRCAPDTQSVTISGQLVAGCRARSP